MMHTNARNQSYQKRHTDETILVQLEAAVVVLDRVVLPPAIVAQWGEALSRQGLLEHTELVAVQHQLPVSACGCVGTHTRLSRVLQLGFLLVLVLLLLSTPSCLLLVHLCRCVCFQTCLKHQLTLA